MLVTHHVHEFTEYKDEKQDVLGYMLLSIKLGPQWLRVLRMENIVRYSNAEEKPCVCHFPDESAQGLCWLAVDVYSSTFHYSFGEMEDGHQESEVLSRTELEIVWIDGKLFLSGLSIHGE